MHPKASLTRYYEYIDLMKTITSDHRCRSLRGCWMTGLAALFIGSALAASASSEVPNFNLLDVAGHNHEMRRAEGKALVLFFTGVGCPIARKSAPKLRELRDQFGRTNLSFWIINTYAEDSTKDIRKEFQELELWDFPYLRDPKQGVALSLGVQRTAEVVAIGLEDARVFYQGAIDDQFSEGAEKPKPGETYLADALREFLAGKPISRASTPSRGCRLSFAKVADEGVAPSYSRQVAPILRQHCSGCHRDGGIGPWALDSYGRAKNYSRMMEEVLLTRRMPPWDPDPDFGHFSNAQVLTREETQTLIQWVKAGTPRDDGPDPLAEPLPPLPEWAMGKPDLVLRLPEPEHIPATGVLEYRHIPLKPSPSEEIWISGTDIRPGNRKVVHHVILYAKWPGAPDDGSGNGVFVCGWAPGTPPLRYPSGAAKRIPAGAEWNVEVHYTTCGSPQMDQSEIALYFAPGPQTREVTVRQAIEMDVNIPPGTDESRHVASYGFRKPATLYSLFPHMHYRGKWMRYELLLPNGKRETLLHVPRYDFKWQLGYVFEKPRHVPAGTWLLVTGAFDNSRSNPANPDASARVRFGLQSWDEMFIGFFDAADDPDPDSKVALR